jgi:phosphoribosylanthranilate isomerase
MVKVKVCGITRPEDALLAVELGAELLGFNFWPQSKRAIDPEAAKKIISQVKGRVKVVGVFVNQLLEEVSEIASEIGLDMVQLHGDESPDFCADLDLPVIKALRLGCEQDLCCLDDYSDLVWLIDSKTEGFGGSGKMPDWELVKMAQKKTGKIILAGGLNPGNVEKAIRDLNPWAVDVASGVEQSPGIKDEKKMEKFFKAVKNVAG